MHILLVEDDAGDARLIREMLVERKEHYELQRVARLEAGLSYVQDNKVDVILLDLSLPDSHGLETVRRMQRHAPHIPVIVLTGLDDRQMGLRAVREGAQDYLIKGNVDGNLLARSTYYAIERKQIEQEHKQLIADLDAYAHTVAHDLRKPLQLIVGHSELLLDDVDALPEAQAQLSLQQINNYARIMSDIIGSLLLLSRIRASEVETAPVQMEQVVQATLQRLHQDIEESGALLELPEQWPTALGEATWLQEVWYNYLSNALKYGGTPPRITLGADQVDDGEVRFWVRDHGVGLSSEEQSQLFLPFSRLHEHEAEGHGLGLSIAQRIVQKLGGRAGVESEEGVGSLFYFTLRAAKQTAVGAPKEQG